MAAKLEAIEAQIKSNKDVESSVVILVKGLADALKATNNDPSKLAELHDGMTNSADRLASAVIANTPAA